jgi:ATP adenylyltransferase
MRDHLFSTEKIKYINGDKPDVECILCAIRERHPRVKTLEVCRSENFIISLNLYPYNPGHLMVFPARHVVKLYELSDEEVIEFHRMTSDSIRVLEEEFKPSGFNVGFNMGENSGASISHIHQHIVPRYNNEVGFLDVLSGTRVVVVEPEDVLRRLMSRLKNYD